MKPKKFDCIVLGTAVVDITASPVDRSIFDKDKTLLEEVRIVPGGDAVNQAVNLAGLGSRVSLCCRLGDDSLGRFLLNEISSCGVNTDNVAVSAGSSTSAAIALVAGSGERTIVSKKGSNYDLCADDINYSAIVDTRALSIASFFCISKLEKEGLCEALTCAKTNSAVTFADSGADKKNEGLSALAPFLPCLDYFLPSETESAHLTGEKDPVKAAQILKSQGVKNVIIKLGKNGAYADCEDYKGFVNPFEITPLDTTGAGDAFCAGFIHSVLNGKSIHEALEFASACGAFTALFFGATTSGITQKKIKRFIQTTPKRNIY